MTTIEWRGVRHRFPGAPADTIRDIDLAVADGEMVAVVGASGSGKSTLLRVAAGLEAPAGGEVFVDGLAVTAEPPERRDLTVMFQRPHLFAHLDVLGNVAFGPRMAGAGRRQSRDIARRYLELVHLDGFERRHPRRLSGGQQQRVALARALATERGVLLLDEPFSSLDRHLRSAMHDLLAEVRAAVSPTVVMVTHDLAEAGLAERAAVLHGGRFVQVAPVAELHHRPATLDVARLVGGFNEVSGGVVRGVHRSPWGEVPLPADCEVLGPATLLLRREHLQLVREDSTDRDVVGLALSGQVVGVRQAGVRQLVTVEGGTRVRAGLRLEVELPLGRTVGIGARVAVAPSAEALPWAVALPATSGTSATVVAEH